jgi:hypothetical protein
MLVRFYPLLAARRKRVPFSLPGAFPLHLFNAIIYIYVNLLLFVFISPAAAPFPRHLLNEQLLLADDKPAHRESLGLQ